VPLGNRVHGLLTAVGFVSKQIPFFRMVSGGRPRMSHHHTGQGGHRQCFWLYPR
jgi:hypothetical protein